jgi:hypothetical protein
MSLTHQARPQVLIHDPAIAKMNGSISMASVAGLVSDHAQCGSLPVQILEQSQNLGTGF